MAWNDGSGDAPRPNGAPNPPPNPWGLPPDRTEPRRPDRPGRPGLPGTPDYAAALARARAWWNRRGGRGNGGRGGGGGGSGRGWGRWTGAQAVGAGVLALLAFWLASGFYRVEPDQQGVVLRFGAYARTTLPGLNYHLPWPIESVARPPVTHINRIEIGYRSGANDTRVQSGRDARGRDVREESLMLTGDENIVDIDFAVFWKIADPVAFLFTTRDPAGVIKAVAESVMREELGRTPIQPALTEARAKIEADVLAATRTIVGTYGLGVDVTQVQLQKVDPPDEVIESFRDVQRAQADADRARNEAEAYRNDVVPRARGDAAALVAGGQAERDARVAEAKGQAQAFRSVLAAYQQAKDVTLRRMYVETMEQVLSHARTTIVDPALKGVLPLLPLAGANVGGGGAGAGGSK